MSQTFCQTTQLHTPEVVYFDKILTSLSQHNFFCWISFQITNDASSTALDLWSTVHQHAWPVLAVYICVTSTLRSPTSMSFPNFRRDVVTSTRIRVQDPDNESITIFRNLGNYYRRDTTSHIAPSSSSVTRSTYSGRFDYKFTVLFTPHKKDLGKTSGKPRHSQWLHLVTAVGVTLELKPRECNL
jgi:hypothetical protein